MAGGAPDQRPQPRQHLLDVERLGDIVVGAGVDARHLVAPAVARGQDQHRHLAAVAPPALDDADAVHLRQADIEHHRVVGLGVAEKMPFLAVERLVDDIAGIDQRVGDLPVQVLVILDDEYAHGIMILLPETGSDIGEFRMLGKASGFRSVLGNDDLDTARALAILARHQHHDDADRLPALVGLACLGQRAAILCGHLLADGIAVGGRHEHRRRLFRRQ